MQNSRHDISDEDWARIEHLLPGRAGGHGGAGKDNRLFINAIRYLAKTGIAWRDLPFCYGNFNSVWQRYNRWCEAGVFERIAEALKDEDQEWLCVNSTCVRATVAAAGAKKSDGSAGQNEQALGRSRGGFGTKIHASITPMGHPATVRLTGGEANDSPHLPDVIAGQETTTVIADKAYGSGKNRRAIAQQNAECVIPSKANRKVKIEYDRHLYKERHVVECYFGKLKRYRRIATRYDKKAQNFLGFIWLASINIMLL